MTLQTAAQASVDRIISKGVEALIAEPDRLTRIVPNASALPLHELRAEVRERLAGSSAAGKAGHWTFDMNRHIALRQADAALTDARFLAVWNR